MSSITFHFRGFDQRSQLFLPLCAPDSSRVQRNDSPDRKSWTSQDYVKIHGFDQVALTNRESILPALINPFDFLPRKILARSVDFVARAHIGEKEGSLQRVTKYGTRFARNQPRYRGPFLFSFPSFICNLQRSRSKQEEEVEKLPPKGEVTFSERVRESERAAFTWQEPRQFAMDFSLEIILYGYRRYELRVR